jgi:hypothetical protein
VAEEHVVSGRHERFTVMIARTPRQTSNLARIQTKNITSAVHCAHSKISKRKFWV